MERDREALSRCGAGAAGGSWDSVGGRQALVRLLGIRTAPEVGGGVCGAWPRASEGSPGLQLTSSAFGTRGLVEGPPAVLGATEAGDLDVLDRELVVVRDLLVDVDVLLRVDDNLLLGLHRDHLGVAVGLQDRVVMRLKRGWGSHPVLTMELQKPTKPDSLHTRLSS